MSYGLTQNTSGQVKFKYSDRGFMNPTKHEISTPHESKLSSKSAFVAPCYRYDEILKVLNAL